MEVRAVERVEELLRAACVVVARDGAHGLTMDAVAREAGVSKALVHYYFSTRRDLLRRAFAYAEERARARALADLPLLSSGIERLERFLLLYLDEESVFRESRALWNEVWSGVRLDDELRPGVEAAYRRWVDQLSGLVREAQSDGSAQAGIRAEDVAWRLAAVVDGLDSLVLLGLIDGAKARELAQTSLRLELGSAGRA